MKNVKIVLVMHWNEKTQMWSDYEIFIQEDFTIDLDSYFTNLYGESNYEYKYLDASDLASLDYSLRR